MLEQNNVVTLSNDQKYLVVYTTKINDSEYCFIINMNDDTDSMVCKILENKEIEVEKDEFIIDLFLKDFMKEMRKN